MIKELLANSIDEKITEPDIALLLSGGVDSISVGLAAHSLGKKVTAYTFKLKGINSYDFDKAICVAGYMGWKMTTIVVPTKNIVEDFKTLRKMGCRKKTHYETVFPFLYVYPHIIEKYVLTGWGADGYFGVSKKAHMRYPPGRTSPDTFDDFRNNYFLPENSAGLNWHNKLVDKYDKVHVHPYLDPKIKAYFYQFNWEQLNKPKEKHMIRDAFKEFQYFGTVKKHQNLQLASGVNVLFETLLNNSEINFKNRSRIMDVCRDWWVK